MPKREPAAPADADPCADGPDRKHVIDPSSELVNGVHVIRLTVGMEDLRCLAALAAKALPDVEAYMDRIADYGDDIGGNQHVLGPLSSSIGILIDRMKSLSRGTFDGALSSVSAFGLDFAPDLRATADERDIGDALHDLTLWLRGFHAAGHFLVGKFPTIDDVAARRFASIVRRLEGYCGPEDRHNSAETIASRVAPEELDEAEPGLKLEREHAREESKTRRDKSSHTPDLTPGNRAVLAAAGLKQAGKRVSFSAACKAAGVNRGHVMTRYPKAVVAIKALASPDGRVKRGRRDPDGYLYSTDHDDD